MQEQLFWVKYWMSLKAESTEKKNSSLIVRQMMLEWLYMSAIRYWATKIHRVCAKLKIAAMPASEWPPPPSYPFHSHRSTVVDIPTMHCTPFKLLDWRFCRALRTLDTYLLHAYCTYCSSSRLWLQRRYSLLRVELLSCYCCLFIFSSIFWLQQWHFK